MASQAVLAESGEETPLTESPEDFDRGSSACTSEYSNLVNEDDLDLSISSSTFDYPEAPIVDLTDALAVGQNGDVAAGNQHAMAQDGVVATGDPPAAAQDGDVTAGDPPAVAQDGNRLAGAQGESPAQYEHQPNPAQYEHQPNPQYLRRWLRRVKKAEKVKEVEKAAPDTKAMKAMKVKKAEKASKASPATKAIDKALDTLGDTRLWSDDKVLGHEARKHCRQAIKHCRKVIKALEALVDE